ncbi:GTPase domain-containing protein [Zooshikella marina]|uniref:GTP-binding protein n=1 Tax=Zooshikella ganghwensis TaxID=202772 RepID=UPI001BAFEDDC|nr:GTPase domain-containing protein [Zooshikella ganghwensis]MBU2708660.1 GTPase domain-containing protein [Zooshikella ganghwensis]
MADFNEDKNTLTLKTVYYGPALSGKTTNLTKLHDLLQPQLRSDMMVLETKNDRTLFFDLLPVGLRTPSGLLVKVKLFTVPGQVIHDSTRKAVLSRADGVVFVADSQLTQIENNAISFENLLENIGKLGLDTNKLPILVQFNKRDLPDIISKDDVINLWKPTPWNIVFSSALEGKGVTETFEGILSQVYSQIDNQYQLHSKHGLAKTDFLNELIRSSPKANHSTNSSQENNLK